MNSKKNSKKLNIFKTSPLLAVIAVIEVIILVCACTFAWFALGKESSITMPVLSVEPDSGLEIDFSAADYNDAVVINNYIKNFKFEPVTSTDGRNIFVPTTGTFDKTDTESMKFREATVNDMNSKYICIDFTLTNTGTEDMPVYLSPKSTFKVESDDESTIEGKALRLAFYQNDGNSGNIGSTLLDTSIEDQTTVYFNNTLGWEVPHAHVWNSSGGSLDGWYPLTHISGNLYYFTFNSDYNSIVFRDSEATENQTVDITVKNGYIYKNESNYTSSNGKNYYSYTESDYDEVSHGNYPVVSPGVSVGFQRPYAPVTHIDNTSGSATTVVPAFAYSIDNYSYGSTAMFTINNGQTMSLSMIIWLEGTDPDCSRSTYAGKDISLDLRFATEEDKDLNNSTYYFYDKTYETWIHSDSKTSTGAVVQPVMQLYDEKNKKGYLMEVCEKNEDGKAITWKVTAPTDILTNGGNGKSSAIFRRVNPLDENEIWNYWDTRGGSSASANTIKGKVPEGLADNELYKIVHFTAFSDGSPEEAYLKDDKGKFILDANGDKKVCEGLLDYSCGGLWGNHDVTNLKLYDGTRDNYLGNNSGVMTINYEYNGQPVEYKASGPANGFYNFIIPDVIFDTDNDNAEPNITFKRYYGFDTRYALNIKDKQEDLIYNYAWENVGTCKGRFFEINQYPKDANSDITNNESFITYWGDEVIYIQNDANFYQQMNNGQWRVNFSNSSKNHYTYLYNHYKTEFKNENGESYWRYYYSDRQSDNSYGYPCVVPSDAQYSQLRVEQCSKDLTSLWNRTPAITLTNNSTEYNDNNKYSKYSNYIWGYNTAEKTNTVINILKLTNLQHTIYFQISKHLVSNPENINVSLYAYGDGQNASWPGTKMEYVSNPGDYSSDSSDSKSYIYLKPEHSDWLSDGRWYAAHFINGSNKEFVTATLYDGVENVYRAEVPSSYTDAQVRWLCMSGSADEPSTDSKYMRNHAEQKPVEIDKCYVIGTSNANVVHQVNKYTKPYYTYKTTESVNVSKLNKAYVSLSGVSNTSVAYLNPTDIWDNDGAWFAAYFYNNSGNKWVKAVKDNSSNLYFVNIPSGYSSNNMIWCRMNPKYYELGWDETENGEFYDRVWNQSVNLSVPTNSNNCYTIAYQNKTDGDSDFGKYEGFWGKNGQVLYLQTNGDWANNNEWYAAYFYRDDNDDDINNNKKYWVTAMRVTNTDNKYFVVVPSGYNKMVWCRMNGATSATDWANVWNQTVDFNVPTNSNITFTIGGKSNDNVKYTGTWSNSDTPLTTFGDHGGTEIGKDTDYNGLIFRGVLDAPLNKMNRIPEQFTSVDKTESIAYESYLSPDWP